MVKLNLQDIAVVFDKGEGHSARKVEEKRWRLIWSVSEVDRILDALVSYDQSHFDVITHQGEFGDLASLATGCGHDDTGLERTYRDLEALLAASPDKAVRSSDASHWDLSVSAATFWTAYQGLDVARADGLCHKRMVVLNGYFASSSCLSTNLSDEGVVTIGGRNLLDLMQAQFDMHVLKAAAFSSSHSQAQAKILSLYMSQPLSCRQDTRKSLLIRGVFHLHWRHFSMACKM